MAERDKQGQKYRRRQWGCRYRREHDGQNNHDAAHRRRTALGLMALRSFLTDALSEFKLMQLWNEYWPYAEHEAGGNNGRKQYLIQNLTSPLS